MPRKLPDSDFRARRIVLTRRDFAYAPNPASPPSDKIARSTWTSIVTLPDDVAIRTSNYHGSTLAELDNLWNAWIECLGEADDCLFSSMLDAADDFQSATYTALTGFYRLSISALRSALELTAIGTWAQVCSKQVEYEGWRSGRAALSFGHACDGLVGATRDLRQRLLAEVNDSLFDQRTQTSEGGFARRIYNGISDYSHARPGHADGDMRDSNGPIYVRSAFNYVSWIHFETMGLCFVMHLLARPRAKIPRAVFSLFADAKRVRSRVTRGAFEALNSRGQ